LDALSRGLGDVYKRQELSQPLLESKLPLTACKKMNPLMLKS
jgi:hypothetical protein